METIKTILQARTSSSRLSGKVLKTILGAPMLLRQIERIMRAKNIGEFWVATSTEDSDDAIAKLCEDHAINCFRGSLDDVLDRYYQVAKISQTDHIVRLTGDCPLIDAEIIDRVISLHLQGGFDYTSLSRQPPTFPHGLDTEIMRFETLEKIHKETSLPSHREHVTLFIYQNPKLFKIGELMHEIDLSSFRWTVDEIEDYDLVVRVYEALYRSNRNFLMQDVLQFFEHHPELKSMNSKYSRYDGLKRSLLKDFAYLKNRSN